MLDNLYRDYLLDRAEAMVSLREGVKSAQETRDRVALGRAGDLARRRGTSTIDEQARIKISDEDANLVSSRGTTLYRSLSLGPGQRFASKGGYIVRLADDGGKRLSTESEFTVP
jgi:hypothetical protein